MQYAQKKIVIITLVFIALLCVGITGIITFSPLRKNSPQTSALYGTFLAVPRSVHAFSLTSTDKHPFTKANLQGKWSFVFFGFTQCSSICPMTMVELNKMYRLLADKGVKNLPQVIMVSIDPSRDNLRKLNVYIKSFNSHFHGATGDKQTLRQMAREFGIAYKKNAPTRRKDTQVYDIEHSGTILLFNPQGKLTAFYTPPPHADFLVSDYLALTV